MIAEVTLSSGQKVYANFTNDEEQEPDELLAQIEGWLRECDRAFTTIGDLIVHTGAVSAVKVQG